MGDRKWSGLLLVLTVAFGLSGCVGRLGNFSISIGGGANLEKETRSSNVEAVADAALHVETANGSIQVTPAKADAKEVTLVAHLRAQTKERLAATKVHAERGEDKTLKVTVEWPDGKRRGNEGCSFEIQTPTAKNVTLRSSNGTLRVEAMGGKADLKTSNGSVTLKQHAGPAIIHTSNGSVTVQRIEGDLRAESRNGRMRLQDAAASVQAKSSNGSLEIALRDSSPGPIDAKTSNGSVRVKLGKGFQGELKARTSNARVRVAQALTGKVKSQDKRSVRLVVGQGGKPSSIRTSNGAVRIEP